MYYIFDNREIMVVHLLAVKNCLLRNVCFVIYPFMGLLLCTVNDLKT